MTILDHFEGFIKGNITVAKTFMSLIKLEARLAGLSLFPLLLNLCMLLVITFGVWFSLMMLLHYCFLIVLNSYLLSVFLIFGVNVLSFFLIIKNLSLHLKRMSFEKTRESLSHHMRTNHESTQTIACRNSSNS